MSESDIEIRKVVDAWLASATSEKGSPEHEANAWASELVFDWAYTDGGDKPLWSFILEAYGRDMPELVFATLAAGALEDLLGHHGPQYIERIEDLARKDPLFNRLLGGVWKNAMTDDIWNRVLAARNEVW